MLEVTGMENMEYRDYAIDRWNQGVRRTRRWAVVLGASMLAAGVFAAFAPYSVYIVVQAVLALSVAMFGGSQLFAFAASPKSLRSPLQLVSGALNVAFAVAIAALPTLLTASAIAYVIAALLVLFGVERWSMARSFDRSNIPGAGALYVSSVVGVLLGVMCAAAPLVASAALGYLAAGYFLAIGAAMIVQAWSMREIER